MTTATPRRRWVQFSLKSLMLLVLVAAVPCGWLKWKMDRKARERAAVVEIKKLGGQVSYDWQTLGHPAEPPGPVWLRKVLGDDFFASVVLVSIGVEGTDDSLVHLETLVDLEKVYVRGKQITDIGMTHLEGLTRLHKLHLCGTGITDAGVNQLASFTGLRDLNLADCTGVTDRGIAHLNGLTQLSRLILSRTVVSDTGLANLKELAQLEKLFLHLTNVTDEGVADLQKALPNCKILR